MKINSMEPERIGKLPRLDREVKIVLNYTVYGECGTTGFTEPCEGGALDG